MRLLQRTDRAVDTGLNFVINSLSNILLYIFTILIFVEVITRYFFGISHGQVSEYCIFFFLWLVFLMSGKVLREKRHINISVLSEKLVNAGKLRTKAVLDIYISITLLVFGVTHIYLGILDVASYKAIGYRSTLDYVPHYWIWHLALPVGALFLCYYAIRELIQNIGFFIKRKETKAK